MALAPLIIVSGPSGSGKSTVLDRLLEEKRWPLRLAVSVTTRKPRPGESPDADYHYWTKEAFLAEAGAGGFLEWADVFGNCYGTLEREVTPFRESGTGVVLEIDVQGWEQVKSRCPEAVSIFIRPPSVEELENRLRKRRSESADELQRRLAGARVELARAGEYEYQVINDRLEEAVAALRAIVGPLFERKFHA
ncbi:MAG: guanylate kinase [Planctomycetes bacterium]|nr:guanylate kinase [Planctomycetota bacterium]